MKKIKASPKRESDCDLNCRKKRDVGLFQFHDLDLSRSFFKFN